MLSIRYSDGLVPVVVQDAGTGDVLMVAYANDEALHLTIQTGYAHYFSRSRQRLWKKGEESGHLQRVREILVDCDEDCLLYRVEQAGAACHTGYRSCFYRTIDGEILGEPLVDPAKVYANKP
ncbi:MAG TPA: phosphoribosyl-AMP cyclohydrolase [Methanoregulaceae archaeon]|nr:phosphoribosyl-AMP cyclohydrolase [Methanoregulaceae archaeon]HQJ88182.1 phosphoribosyl-AMP cyclohydrolase [Methanoregulaceae archaeon]